MSETSSQFLPYEITDINHPSVLPYRKEINETEENIATGVEILRRDFKNVKDIEPCLDEEFLLFFLRVSKYDTAKAYQRLLNFYQKIDGFAKTFKKITFPLERAESLQHMRISPYRCQNNSFLILGHCGIDYKKYTFAERFYLEVICIYQLIKNPINQICGGTYILDYEGFDIHGLLASTPGWIRYFLDFLVNVFPCRLKAVHVVNVPSLFVPIWKIGHPFLSKKMQTRFFLYPKSEDWSSLHAHISPDILPENYGGKLKQSELIRCMDNLEELEQNFRNLIVHGYTKTRETRQALKVLC